MKYKYFLGRTYNIYAEIILYRIILLFAIESNGSYYSILFYDYSDKRKYRNNTCKVEIKRERKCTDRETVNYVLY